MKQWIYIMIVYFLGLAMQPCADTDFFVSGHLATQSQYLDKHHQEDKAQHHEGDEAHECNPFCICACCGVQVLPNPLTVEVQKPITLLFSELFIKRTFQIPTKYISDIWQPPKITIL